MTEDRFLAAVERLTAAGLTPLGAAILVAVEMGIARDSRSFARIFGVAHALVLREGAVLAHDLGLIDPSGDGPRRAYSLTQKGQGLILGAR